MEDSDPRIGSNGDSSEKLASPPFEEKLQKLIDKTLYGGGQPAAQKLRNFLNGTWLGEPLHVVLTDLPVGAWTTAMVFDALNLGLDRREFATAADTSITIGLVAAMGAAVTGLADWSDVDPPARRIGLIHGLLNLGGTALFATSLILRKKKSRRNGLITSTIGYALMAYAAHLGGKMVYEHRVGVDQTDGQIFPDHFVAVLPALELADSKPTRVTHHGVPILLVRRGEELFAMADTCSHMSGPLSEGKLEGNSILCPYHSSRFALENGCVLDGPAVHPQPCLEVRTHNGKIEVRKHPARNAAASV